MKKKDGKLKLTLQFDLKDDSFARFFKALVDGGFKAEVQEMGKAMLEEAKRRNLPIVDELGLGEKA